MIGSLRFPHLRAHTFVNGAYALGAWRIPGRVVHVRARAPSVRGTVLVAESYGERLTAFEIDADGGLSGRRTWADTPGHHPDGICVDAAGAVWYADVGTNRCVRVAEGGEVLDTVVLDRGCFACMLGGNDDQTLFIVAQRWGEAPDPIAPTGQVLTVRAPSPHAGRP
jgi:sugar lactone lactonase YvrE